MPKRIALLDVDDTLLYGDYLNHTLVEALIEAGIDEIYLFTNMDLADIKFYGREGVFPSRHKIITYLESKGLTVKGVITPADPFLGLEGIGKAYQTLYVPEMKKRLTDGKPLELKEFSEDYLSLMFSSLHWDTSTYILRSTIELAKGTKKAIGRPGYCLVNRESKQTDIPPRFIVSFDEAKAFFITSAEAEMNRQTYFLEKRAHPEDLNIMISSNENTSSDPKGLMMEYLLQKTDFIKTDTRIFYFDDRADHLKAVDAVVRDYKGVYSVVLHTCLMPLDYEQSKTPQQKLTYQKCLRDVKLEDAHEENLASAGGGVFSFFSNKLFSLFEKNKLKKEISAPPSLSKS